jgi:hypothetical protein
MLIRSIGNDRDLTLLAEGEFDMALIPVVKEKQTVERCVLLWGEAFREDFRYLKNNRYLATHRSGEVVLKYIEVKVRQKYEAFGELDEAMKNSIKRLHDLLGAKRSLAEFLEKFWTFLEVAPRETE